MMHERAVSPILHRLETLRREDLLAFQFAILKHQIERCWSTNSFYRTRWQRVGAAPEKIKSFDDFRKRIPTVTKQDFLDDQLTNPPFGERLGIPREDVRLVVLTGGTTGQGQEIYGRNAADVAVLTHMHYLPYHLAGLRKGDIAFNCAPAGGMTSGGWGPPEGMRQGGAIVFNVGGVLSTEAKIDLMLRFGVMHFIYASTNYLHTLTEALRRRGLDPRQAFPMMKALYIAAEGYSPKWAQTTENIWGCPLHEGYGSTQATGFAYTSCPSVRRSPEHVNLLHALEWWNLMEVIVPETGESVGPGEEGEIILTNLTMAGSPCIRFSTRDKARWFPHDACSCGRPWHCIEAGSVGRYDDMMKIRGNNVWPISVDAVVFAHAEVGEYAGRVFVDDFGRTEVEVRVAFKPEFAAAPCDARTTMLQQIANTIKAKTNVTMTVMEVPRAELPTFEYKARRWKDERQAGYDRTAKNMGVPHAG